MLLGIFIGVYFTLNTGIFLFLSYDDWGREWNLGRWYAWPLVLLFGSAVVLVLIIYEYLQSLHKWLDKNNWYYRWINDTLGYERFLGMVNRFDKRQLTRMQGTLKLDNWPRRKLMERIDERLKEMSE